MVPSRSILEQST